MNAALRLARIALQAEGLVVRGRFGAALTGAVLFAVAALFGIVAFAFAHVAAMAALLEEMRIWWAALLIAAVDVTIALVIMLIAARMTKRKMRRALAVRDGAMHALMPALGASVASGVTSGSALKMAMGAGLLVLLVSRLR